MLDLVAEGLAGVAARAGGAATAVEATDAGLGSFGDDASVGGTSTLNISGASFADRESNGYALLGGG